MIEDTALATRDEVNAFQAMETFLTGKSDHFRHALTRVVREAMPAERLIKLAMFSMTKNPQLVNCTKVSLFFSILGAAEIGLEPDTPLKHGNLIPLRNKKKDKRTGQESWVLESQFWPQYFGLAHCAYRARLIRNLSAQAVHEADEFDHDLGTGFVRHKRILGKDRGPIVGVYCRAVLAEGLVDLDVMDVDEVEAVRLRSRGKDSDAWKYHWPEMAKKTVLKRLLKTKDLTPDLAMALNLSNQEDAAHPARYIASSEVAQEVLKSDPELAAQIEEETEDAPAGPQDASVQDRLAQKASPGPKTQQRVPAGPEAVSQEQAADLLSLLGEYQKGAAQLVGRFGVSSVYKIPADQYDEAVAWICGS